MLLENGKRLRFVVVVAVVEEEEEEEWRNGIEDFLEDKVDEVDCFEVLDFGGGGGGGGRDEEGDDDECGWSCDWE